MTPQKQYYETLAASIIKELEKRQMEGYYAASKEEALQLIQSYLTPEVSAAYGGSMTLEALGFPKTLIDSGCTFYDRFADRTPAAQREIFGKIATADYYFMSTNAITSDGILVNIDGSGNRVASLIHGPQNVIIVAGMNKLAPSLEAAIERARNTAAVPNCIRLNKNTPCTKTGKCMNCQSPDCICNQIVITRRSMIPNRIKVILVGESLGY